MSQICSEVPLCETNFKANFWNLQLINLNWILFKVYILNFHEILKIPLIFHYVLIIYIFPHIILIIHTYLCIYVYVYVCVYNYWNIQKFSGIRMQLYFLSIFYTQRNIALCLCEICKLYCSSSEITIMNIIMKHFLIVWHTLNPN